MIPYSDFARLISAADECETLETYMAEIGGSVPLDDMGRTAAVLTALWEMAHDGLTIKSIATACNTSMRQIGLQLGISRRTIGNWATGVAAPPEWQLPLIAYAVMSDYITR